MNYSLAKVKTFEGVEGMGFNCTVLSEGKPVAKVTDDAWGGECRWDWINKSAEAPFKEMVAEAYPDDGWAASDIWVCRELDVFLAVQHHNKKMSTHIYAIMDKNGEPEMFVLKRNKKVSLESYEDQLHKAYGSESVLVNIKPLAERKEILAKWVIEEMPNDP